MQKVMMPVPPDLSISISKINEHLSWICEHNEEKSKAIWQVLSHFKCVCNKYDLQNQLEFILQKEFDEDLNDEHWKWVLPRLDWLETDGCWYMVNGELQLNSEKVIQKYEQEPLEIPDGYIATSKNMARLCNLLNTFVKDKYGWTVTLDIYDYGWTVQKDSAGIAFRYDFRPDIWLWYKAVDYNRAKNKKPADDK